MNKILIIYLFLLTFVLSSCNTNENNTQSSIIKSTNTTSEALEMNLLLKIDGNILNVNWEKNDSVNELKELAKNTLTINMHEYGGFEQTGSIGKSITRNDSLINVIPGDIVLYNSNAISVFYNSSSWSYTKLGHINLDNNELNNILNKSNVTFVLELANN